MSEKQESKICIEPFCWSERHKESVFCEWHIKERAEFHRAFRI